MKAPVVAIQAWYDHGTARDSIQEAAFQAAVVEREQVLLLAAAIISVVTNERLAEVSRVSLASSLSVLELTRRRAAHGVAHQLDVLRIEQEVSESREQVIGADESLQRAREQLGDALGSSEAWGVTQNMKMQGLVNGAASSCASGTKVDQRPDVRAATASRDIAQRSVTSVSYAYLPTVDAVSTVTYWPVESEVSSPNRYWATWTVGGVLSWQIYDGGLRSGTRAARRSELDVANQQLKETRRRAQIETTQSLRAVKAAAVGLEVSKRTRALAKETARLTRLAFLKGTGSSYDLVESARKLRIAELSLAIKEAEVAQARIEASLALASCTTR
jgi:outer membrane protein TolC